MLRGERLRPPHSGAVLLPSRGIPPLLERSGELVGLREPPRGANPREEDVFFFNLLLFRVFALPGEQFDQEEWSSRLIDHSVDRQSGKGVP
jgi:hypothetical protein